MEHMLKCKNSTTKRQEEYTKENPCDLESGKHFLDGKQKAQTTEEKTDKLNFIKTKDSCPLKGS